MCFQMTLQKIGNSAESTTHSIIIICLNHIIFSGAGDLIDPELFASGFGKCVYSLVFIRCLNVVIFFL